MSLRYVYMMGLFYLSGIAISCGDKDTTDMGENREINLDQDVTNQLRPQDTVFLNFEKNWQKFISQDRELVRPVEKPRASQAWEPVIISDCVFSADIGGPVPYVDITWQARDIPRTVRFDLTLHYQGFERNYYTTILPAKEQERFNLPGNSAFIKDTAAVLLTGPPLFPKMVNFQQEAVRNQGQSQPPGQDQTQDQGDIAVQRYALRLQDLGPGLSYRIRMCTFDQEVWTPTREVVFTTPICPLDRK